MRSPTNNHTHSLTRLVLILFLGASVWKVWLGEPAVLPVASAQIPDSGMQRRLLLAETRKTNQLLLQLIETIKTGTFKVRIVGTDNKAAAKRGGGGP